MTAFTLHQTASADIPFKPWTLFRAGGLPRRAVLCWLLAAAVAVPTGMLTRLLEWTGLPVQVGGVTVYLTIYLPLLVCIPLVIWYGYLWAAIPAYFSTFGVALLGGMPLEWIFVFSLANPLGLAMYTMLYRVTRTRLDHRKPSSVLGFAFISLIAALVGSVGSFVWAYTADVSPDQAYPVWQGWWLGGWLQSLLLVTPVLLLFGPEVERRLKPLKADGGVTPRRLGDGLLPAIVSTVGVLSVYVFVARMFSLRQFEAVATDVGDESLKVAINNAFAGLTYPLFVLVAAIIAAGFFAYRAVSFWSEKLVEANEQLAVKNAELVRLADSDPLTGLYNRRRIHEILDYELLRSGRSDSPLSVLMIDVDEFKAINDTHGHLVGDEVIRDLAGLLSTAVRDCDSVGRYGGEEFIAVLPETELAFALEVAERLRASVEDHETRVDGASLAITVSVGVATALAGQKDGVVERADGALLAAKAGGRNQVVSDLAPIA